MQKWGHFEHGDECFCGSVETTQVVNSAKSIGKVIEREGVLN